MIPAKIEDVFVQITTDFSGIIKTIDAGNFVKKEFEVNQLIYTTCPFLEGTLEAIEKNQSFLLEGMVIASDNNEFNVDIEIFKNDDNIVILIHNRTNVYKYVDQLNQNRNDIFFIKREIVKKNKELDRLRKIADKANEEKSRFLAIMSHEIRNPLNSILGYAEMISSEKLSKNVAQYIKNLSSAGKNLKVIVDDILDLSRIEAGKLALVSEEVSINEIIKNCENDFQHQQKNNGVSLVFKVTENVPKIVLGDTVRIYQILSNLISNAIKFTEKGSVTTKVDVISEDDKTVSIQFTVADSGRGMSKEQTQKIFEEYQQNKISDNRIKGGAGLGLAIVNRLINAMNGNISVESKLDFGTTFFVKIPFLKPIKNKKFCSEQETKKTIINLKDRKILVADDDVLNLTIVQHFLTKEKAKITLVKDGLEALSKIKKEHFDVILLDIYMPNLTGEELILKVNDFTEFNKNTPVLALTANSTEEDVKRYLEIGFSGIISKPFTSAMFLEKIASTL
ncbi:ATP-binding response regulator [Polaribacter septentrionalilitoris]|uniref:ATP-binding response regulator n=1 Tax=Polaribacter septentrionalilitoris TaxID=2494657 RepID=UPI00135B9A5C|nr:ATP-binding protein [Polaribacter septentrionalilitoris]